MNLVTRASEEVLTPLYQVPDNELTVAITSLSIGGAERIVLDWAARIYPRWRVHLIVLYDRKSEWPVPSHVRVTRLHRENIVLQLEELGSAIARKSIPVCACHLLKKIWRDALGKHGAQIVTVLHNAKDGWEEGVPYFAGLRNLVAVSESCAHDLRENGWEGPITVVRHIPPRWNFAPDARERYRREWNIPLFAQVIGMIGAVKPQKNYLFALRILKKYLEESDAYLVIVGGPVNMSTGRESWESVIAEINRLGIRHRVAMPGFISGATACLPAFDVVLNTSHFEGLSIATLEVLLSGLPTVASHVGGQGEVNAEGLKLLDINEPEALWVAQLREVIGKTYTPPPWTDFPSYRLWTLLGIARPVTKNNNILFVTANLNSGGAQRSLVNLVGRLSARAPLAVMVTNRPTAAHFTRELTGRGISVELTSEKWDPFYHAEMIMHKICAEEWSTVCFWNLDARVKSLVVKALAFTSVRFVDVSPGGYSFEEMDEIDEFGELIAFDEESYYQRLDRLVLKWQGPYPEVCTDKVSVIPNGVPEPRHPKSNFTIGPRPRVVVSGRMAPSKFIIEIVNAMRIVRSTHPNAELHFYGAAESTDAAYATLVLEHVGSENGKNVFFHGPHFGVVELLHEFDAYVVLGKHQGCPNALLEALAVGMPSVGNDDGGTREQIIDRKTGLLIHSCEPAVLAGAIAELLSDRVLAERLGRAGRAHVQKQFSMGRMVGRYAELLGVGDAAALPGSSGEVFHAHTEETEEETGQWVLQSA